MLADGVLRGTAGREQELATALQGFVDEILGVEEEEQEEEEEEEDIDQHLEEMLFRMGTSMESIEGLAKELDPDFEPDPCLTTPHPYTLSVIKGIRCVAVIISSNDACESHAHASQRSRSRDDCRNACPRIDEHWSTGDGFGPQRALISRSICSG